MGYGEEIGEAYYIAFQFCHTDICCADVVSNY